jgi:hypothetical protein
MQYNFDSNNYCIILIEEGWMSGLNRTPGKRVQSICSDAGSNPAPSAIGHKCYRNLQISPFIFISVLRSNDCKD